MLETKGPSSHNAMLGLKVKHSKSTNYDDGDDDIEARPVKRLKRSPPDDEESLSLTLGRDDRLDGVAREIADSDADSEAEDLELVAATEKKTDLETAYPPIKTDKEAIAEYEATRAAEEGDVQSIEGRLSQRKWIKGKSSIYVDAFNLALETVLQDESHLFDEAEMAVFAHWRELSYEAQYLYAILPFSKCDTSLN